jgi:uncharacterized tellurite resistance protein B-like protein
MDVASWPQVHAVLDETDGELDAAIQALELKIGDSATRKRVKALLESFAEQVPDDSPERQALAQATDALEADDRGSLARFRTALGSSLRERVHVLRDHWSRSEELEAGLAARVAADWPSDDALPDEATLHRLCVGASILAHVVHLDGAVEDGEVEALRAALMEGWGLGAHAARHVTALALDEAAEGLDLYASLRDFFEHTEEDERQRFLASVFRVAAGDGRATYDEIEEVRRIGRGLLLSHRYFIEAKLTLDETERDT